MNKIHCKMPAKVRAAFKKRNKFTIHYDEQSGHLLISKALYPTRQAAVKVAAENGYRPDIDQMEDIHIGWAAFRFNGNGPTRYAEVESGARGAFPVWIFPALLAAEYF